MTASTNAFYYVKPNPGPVGGALAPETAPGIIWGQGTPAAIAPFTSVNRGSLYMEVNGTADETCVWMKVAEDGDANDYVRVLGTISNFARVATASSSTAEVDFRTVVTGTGATWASTGFMRMEAGNGNGGYVSALELETKATNSNSAVWCVLSLNAIGADTNRHNNSSYVAIWDYGTTAKRLGSLFYFGSLGTVPATASSTAIISKLGAGQETTCDVKVRFMVADVPYWFLASTSAPA